MFRKLYLIMSMPVLLLTSCTKDFTIQPRDSKPLVVIEGRVSNMRGPYFVRVTRSFNSLQTTPDDDIGFWEHVDPVKDALVIITDDMGTADTLIPADPQIKWYRYVYKDGKFDSALTTRDYSYMSYTADQGYYQTGKLTGVPGHTYRLTVRIGKETYQASAYMPPAPELDSVALGPYVLGSKFAYAWFGEPKDQENYYMMQVVEGFEYPYDAAYPMSIDNHDAFPYTFDDKTLPAYVSHMEVDAYISERFGPGLMKPYEIDPIWAVQVRLGSLTSNTHDYFKMQAKQFVADGNAYKPAPATAAGNISGGALGLFWAVSYSTKLILP